MSINHGVDAEGEREREILKKGNGEMNMRESESVCGREGDSDRKIYRRNDTGGTHAYNLITVYIFFALRIYAFTSLRALCHHHVHFACAFRRHPRFSA